MNTCLLILGALPSLTVFWLMVCHINARKRKLFSLQLESLDAWVYLLILGGSMATWLFIFKYRTLPSWDKQMMDLAVCLYFGKQSYRSYRVKKLKKCLACKRGLKNDLNKSS